MNTKNTASIRESFNDIFNTEVPSRLREKYNKFDPEVLDLENFGTATCRLINKSIRLIKYAQKETCRWNLSRLISIELFVSKTIPECCKASLEL
jgi:hypothetical protein